MRRIIAILTTLFLTMFATNSAFDIFTNRGGKGEKGHLNAKTYEECGTSK